MLKDRGREINKSQASGPSSDAPKKNRFYAIRSRSDEVDFLDNIAIMLQVFFINVYDLVDPDETSCISTP